MTKVIAKTYSATREHQAFLNSALIGFCLISAMVYGAYLYSMINHTVAIQKTEKEISGVQSLVQNLDAKYIALSSNVTAEMAKNFGLHEAPVSLYVNRTASLGTVAIRATEL